MKRSKLILSVLLVSCLTASSLCADDAESSVVAGTKIGRIAVGMGAAQAANLLGPVSLSTGGGTAGGSDTWLSKPRDGKAETTSLIYSAGSSKPVVAQITVTSPFFRTAGGVNTQSDLAALWREFPSLHYLSGGDNSSGAHLELYDAPEKGIAFLIQRTPHPGEGESWGKCVGVIVHQRGKTAEFVRVGDATP